MRSLAINTVFICFTILLIDCSHSTSEVGVPLVFFLFLESLFLFLSLHPYLLHPSVPLSFVYSGEEELRSEREEEWGVIL